LNLDKHEDSNRLTIVGLWGDYIFKPQSDDYPQLPENEDLTMHLAEAAKINVVPHSLIRLADGRLGYITKRIDRTTDGQKIDMEVLLSGKNKLKALYLLIHRYCSRFTHPGAWFSVSNCKYYKIHLF